MRDFKGMKRQRGRNNRGGTGSGGKPQQHNANRAFDSNGPEGVKVRGAAQGVYEKYQQLARDATSSGDRVLAENYLQHAEHYFRVLRAIQPNRPVSDIIGQDPVAGRRRVAGQLLVFFVNALGRAAHLHAFGTVRIEGPVSVVLLRLTAGIAAAAIVAAALALHALEISHVLSEPVRKSV